MIANNNYQTYKLSYKLSDEINMIDVTKYNDYIELQGDETIDQTLKMKFSNTLKSFKNMYDDFSSNYHAFCEFKKCNGKLDFDMFLISNLPIDQIKKGFF